MLIFFQWDRVTDKQEIEYIFFCIGTINIRTTNIELNNLQKTIIVDYSISL